MKLYKITLYTLFILFIAPHDIAHSRELHGRLGLGFNSQFASALGSQKIPGISLKYGLMEDLHVAGIIGFASSSPSQTLFALKAFQNIFKEVNLNFYGLLGLATISANARTSYEVLGGFGSEFFIPGIESLGFSVEVGISLSNLTQTTILKTMGAHFLDAGIHFYF